MNRSRETIAERIARLSTIREGLATIALAHPANHACMVCRAVHGDEDALVELLDGMGENDLVQFLDGRPR